MPRRTAGDEEVVDAPQGLDTLLSALETYRFPGETDEAFAERMTQVLAAAPAVETPPVDVKGPDPSQWGAEARAERGAVGGAEQPSPEEVEAQKAEYEQRGSVNHETNPPENYTPEDPSPFTAHDLAVRAAAQQEG